MMLNRFLIKYLGTHGGEVYPPAVQELATTAVLRAIKSPVSSFSDRNALLEVGLTHVIFTFICLVISHQIILFHNISYNIISYHVISYHIISYLA